MSRVEEWRRLDDRYRVSNRGRVFDSKTNRFAKQWVDRTGRLTVTLHGQPKRTAMIVAALWLGLKPGQHVYYKRGIDPRASNLIVARPVGRRRWNARLTAAKARAIARSSSSIAALAAKYRVSPTCIHQVRAGVTWGWATNIKRKAST